MVLGRDTQERGGGLSKGVASECGASRGPTTTVRRAPPLASFLQTPGPQQACKHGPGRTRAGDAEATRCGGEGSRDFGLFSIQKMEKSE